MAADIPVIDISPSNKEAASQLLAAATDNGFVFVENNDTVGIAPTDIKDMFNLVSLISLELLPECSKLTIAQSNDFFKSPVSVKQEYAYNANRGWASVRTESLDPVKHGVCHLFFHTFLKIRWICLLISTVLY